MCQDNICFRLSVNPADGAKDIRVGCGFFSGHSNNQIEQSVTKRLLLFWDFSIAYCHLCLCVIVPRLDLGKRDQKSVSIYGGTAAINQTLFFFFFFLLGGGSNISHCIKSVENKNRPVGVSFSLSQ